MSTEEQAPQVSNGTVDTIPEVPPPTETKPAEITNSAEQPPATEPTETDEAKKRKAAEEAHSEAPPKAPKLANDATPHSGEPNDDEGNR